MHAGLRLSEAFLEQLSDKEFREEFMADQVRMKLAVQIRALREQLGREWSQAELGRRTGKSQSGVARIEDPDYGKLTLQTLFEIAAAFDLPLLVELPEWDEWLQRTSDFAATALERESFNAENLRAKCTPKHLSVTEHHELELRTDAQRSAYRYIHTDVKPANVLDVASPKNSVASIREAGQPASKRTSFLSGVLR